MVVDMVFKKKILSKFSDLRNLETDFESFLKLNRIPSDVVYDIKMAIHEYLLNVMEHGYHWLPDKEIDFEATIKESNNQYNIDIVIQDYASKFEISKEKIIKSVNNKSFRGRGLLMILTFVDDIIYDPNFTNGNRVILKKSFTLPSK